MSLIVFSLNDKVTKNISEVCNDTGSLESQGLPFWAIALIVVGGLVFIAIMVTLFSLKIQKDRKKYKNEFKSTLINS